MDISAVQKFETAREIEFDQCRCYVHENHRWCLPLVFAAQEKILLPRPCTMVMFDAHHDCKMPYEGAYISNLRNVGFSTEDLIGLCDKKLDSINGDWVIAGMELGLIGDAVLFGVRDHHRNSDLNREGYTDQFHSEHRIKLLWLPGQALQYQGDLSDNAKARALKELWAILDWEPNPETGFRFGDRQDSIWLNIDLDCFRVEWSDYYFPWPDEVFEKEFEATSNYNPTRGWSGKSFFQALVNRAGLITIARESRCCGGGEKSDVILKKLNNFLFDNKLKM